MLDAQYVHQLNKNVWYSGLNISFQEFICRHALTLTFEKDARVFLSGQRFNGMYAVLEGAVRLGYIDIHGKEAIAAIAEPIMWFGEISLVDQLPRSHDAISTKSPPYYTYRLKQFSNYYNNTLSFGFVLPAHQSKTSLCLYGTHSLTNAKFKSTSRTASAVYFKWIWK